jgi:hypothetical protein
LKQKALFAIREVQTGKILTLPVFDKKDLAKKHRQSLNSVSEENVEIFDYVVTYGPDHDKFDLSKAVFKQVTAETKAVPVTVKNKKEVEVVMG